MTLDDIPITREDVEEASRIVSQAFVDAIDAQVTDESLRDKIKASAARNVLQALMDKIEDAFPV